MEALWLFKIMSLVENNQFDGGVAIPEALIPYTGFDSIDFKD